MNDEQQIRELIERWATAAHEGDMPPWWQTMRPTS